MITIITINYNNREGLQRTFESVESQICRDFEYIVVDGGSTDGSRELIEENDGLISKWVSEPDKGIYNAMNKGVRMASGEYCLFLNSGDILHDPHVMERISKVKSQADILFGEVLNVGENGKQELYVPSHEMTLLWIVMTGIHHAGSLIRTSLMLKYPYDEGLKICSDRKFFVQALVVDNCEFHNLDFIVCDFETTGVSSRQTALKNEEVWIIMNELFPPRLVEDYKKTNVRIQQMTSRLVICRQKIVALICGLDILIIKLFKLILRSKLYHK